MGHKELDTTEHKRTHTHTHTHTHTASLLAQWLRICLQCRRPGFDPWVGKTPRRKGW